nr:uncharacterized protein LOC129165521 [Nothobranchius furzeri]
MAAAAQRRKTYHDQRVKSSPLAEGQQVLLRQHGIKGRHKIHDLWSPVIHLVVKAPKEGSPVYGVAPVEDQTKVRHVHHSMFKPLVGTTPLENTAPPPRLSVQQEDEGELSMNSDLDEGDLFVLEFQDYATVPTPTTTVDQVTLGAPRAEAHPAPTVVSPTGPTESELMVTQAAPLVSQPTPVAHCPAVTETNVRRTQRRTAGRHSNLHHLPRPVEGSEQQAEPLTADISGIGG